uniref:T-cell receptor alpha/delta variable 23.3.8 n=1 Tax=Sinocyclocheilus grahami TaxID=75366 RepID=A0A672Q6W0_SINGR
MNMDRCFILILIVGTGTEKNTEERETVKLSCSYSTNSQYVRLYWYRQYHNREPEYLLLKNARSAIDYEHTSDHRFQLTALHTSTELTITDVRLSDSALYYCALRVGAHTEKTKLKVR